MSILLQGIYWGLLLAILVGPLLVALIQASLEQGTRAGLMVALGIWVSDFLFIVTAYYGFRYIEEIAETDGFQLTVGIVGAIVLLITGVITLKTPPPALDNKHHLLKGTTGSWGLWSKGFLINTINPFTVAFWLTAMNEVILARDYDSSQSALFFGGLLGTILFTDSLKISLSHVIRHRLTPRHLWWVRRLAGFALIVFAFALVGRVWLAL